MKKAFEKISKRVLSCLLATFLMVGNVYAENPIVYADRANVYISTSSSQVIDQKTKGEALNVLSEDQSWYKVKLDEDNDGYIRKSDTNAEKQPYQYTTAQTGTVIKSYCDESIQVSIEKLGGYYVTKVWLKNPAQQVNKKEAGWGVSLVTVEKMLNATQGAIVGCNGSGFLSPVWPPQEKKIKATNWNKTTEGFFVISNGTIRRQIKGESCISVLGILPNGSLKWYENSSYEEVINDGVRNTFTFGPILIKDGQKYREANPRRPYLGSAARLTVIGQVDENNFIILNTINQDTLDNAAEFGLRLNCNLLYNLDGGGSSTLWIRNGIFGAGTQITAYHRQVGDAIYFSSLRSN